MNFDENFNKISFFTMNKSVSSINSIRFEKPFQLIPQAVRLFPSRPSPIFLKSSFYCVFIKKIKPKTWTKIDTKIGHKIWVKNCTKKFGRKLIQNFGPKSPFRNKVTFSKIKPDISKSFSNSFLILILLEAGFRAFSVSKIEPFSFE